MNNKDSNNKAIIVWIGCLLTGIVQFIMLFIDTDDEFLQQHAKEASNWMITSIIVYVVCAFLIWLILPILFMIAIGFMHLVFCILGAINASNGQAYHIPVPMLRLIK